MNRTGLFIALMVAVGAGLLFGLYPQLDLALSHLFYRSEPKDFLFGPVGTPEHLRRALMWITWAVAAPAMVAPLVKLFRTHKTLLIPGRAVIFLLISIFLTAIVLPNIFKENWGRPRPIATSEFNGDHTFRPWWDPRGSSRHNGSFYSGEAATAFWTYAPASLAPPAVRPLAFAAATIFGLTVGILRMAFGGHYASDVIAAGVVTFLVVWVVHGFVYRWKKSARFTDEQIDQSLSEVINGLKHSKWFCGLVAAVLALTVVRLVALHFSVVDLFPDEARYWTWAQAPAFGYGSKPPLIAWIIAGYSRICGNSEACLRAPAPLFYAGTALIVFFLTRHLYDERTAFWAGLGILCATGVAFSARVISTDVPLLFFWALSLLAYVKLLDTPTLRWSVLLGLSLGFGLLAKYAMIYFLLGMCGVSFVDRRARSLWRQPAIWLALVIALLTVVPNLVWNARHELATFRHTWGNISGVASPFDPLGPLAFLAGQFAVCGPIIFVVFLALLLWPSRFRLQPADRIMVLFALPPLVLVTIAAFITSAKANWAAPAAVSITVVIIAVLVRQQQWRWLQVSIALGLVAQLVFITADAFADRVSVPFLPQPDIYHRTMGWKAMAMLVRQAADVNGAQSIAAEQSDVLPSLVYYLRDDVRPILQWPTRSELPDQFENDSVRLRAASEPLLLVCNSLLPYRLNEPYSNVETLEPIDVATGPHSTRRFYLFKLSTARR